MKSRNYMAFIVEGESREPQVINNLWNVHFKHSNFKVITLPAGQNIYMLWQKINEDDFEIWRELLNVFVMRVSCLFNVEKVISYDTYCDSVNPYTVYNCQKNYISQGKVFILSGFPEFLLDYFSAKFWNACIKCTRKLVGNCQGNEM